jgi:geranylgeranylglycerol-phosphate geranylgeranyltransferase
MGFLGEMFRLTRFEHAIMLALAVLIAETIVLGGFPPLDLILALSLIVPLFSEMGAFALNDYFDIETDRLNKKTDRPLVKGTISPRFALFFSAASLGLSAIFAFPINSIAFSIVVLFNFAAIAYNWKLKDLPLVGNIYIALTMAIPFIFGNFVYSGTLSPVSLALAALGFVAGLSREIVKSVQDMEGDVKARGSKTLPVVIGKTPSLWIAVLLYLLFIPLSFAPFLLGLGATIAALALVAMADLVILWICYNLIARKAYKMARDYSLAAFLMGLAGLLIAVL